MGTVIAIEAAVMFLLVLNGWRIQLRDWRAERRSLVAGQTPQVEPSIKPAKAGAVRRSYGRTSPVRVYTGGSDARYAGTAAGRDHAVGQAMR